MGSIARALSVRAGNGAGIHAQLPIRRSIALAVAAIWLTASSSWPPPVHAKSISYDPGITYSLTVMKPSEELRMYGSSGVNSIWKPGLPVVVGDRVTVQAFAATGLGQLQALQIKLDGKLLTQSANPPFTAAIDTAALPLGYHFVEIWAQEKSSKTASATKSFSFFLCSPKQYLQTFSPVVTSDPTPPVSPVDSSSIDSTASLQSSSEVAIPEFIENGQLDESAGIVLTVNHGSQRQRLFDSQSLSLMGNSTFTVSAPSQSTAISFYYALVRDAHLTFAAKTSLSLSEYSIGLQAKSHDQPGLLPGVVVLSVWGIDSEGKHGLPVSINVHVPTEPGGDQ